MKFSLMLRPSLIYVSVGRFYIIFQYLFLTCRLSFCCSYFSKVVSKLLIF